MNPLVLYLELIWDYQLMWYPHSWNSNNSSFCIDKVPKSSTFELFCSCNSCKGLLHPMDSSHVLRPLMTIADHNLRTCNSRRGSSYLRRQHGLSLVFPAQAQLDLCKRYSVGQISCDNPQCNEFHHQLIRWMAHYPTLVSKLRIWSNLDGKFCQWREVYDHWLAYCRHYIFLMSPCNHPHNMVFPISWIEITYVVD